MERLTRPNINVDPGTDRFLNAAIGGKEIDWKQSRDSTLNVLINGPTSNGFGKDIFRKMARDLYGRLKAYEDTGIEPEAVETVKLALAAKHMVDLETLNNTPISRLVELAEADKDGRVVVLPCKVGDTVWRIKRTFETYPDKSEPYIEPDAFLLQDVFNIGKNCIPHKRGSRPRAETSKRMVDLNGIENTKVYLRVDGAYCTLFLQSCRAQPEGG